MWLIDKRDNSGAHNSDYHGNFVPQIPRQLFSRYTKKGDWILDPFLGSGTSVIEAQRMKRNAVVVELQQKVLDAVAQRIAEESDSESTVIQICGDSSTIDLKPTLDEFKNSFGRVIDNTTKFLGKNRYCAVVIGDQYANGQVVPLGFHCTNLFLEKGFWLKGIIVKNFGETKGKANQQ